MRFHKFNKLSGCCQSEGITIKEIELKVLSELMKNSSRSDRELAKAIGSSQPTVSRTRKKIGEARIHQRIYSDT